MKYGGQEVNAVSKEMNTVNKEINPDSDAMTKKLTEIKSVIEEITCVG